jgi:hypothetical protein
LKGRDYVEDPGRVGRILKINYKEIGLVETWTGFICLRIETNGGLF